MTVGLVACGKRKLDHPAPARDLYSGHLFVACRRYVEAMCDEWAILSALHGLVLPDEVLAPYSVKLNHLTPDQRAAWRHRVRTAVGARWPGVPIVTTAGVEYRAALTGPDVGEVWCPWDHLPDGRMGFQLRWLAENTPA